MSFILDALRKSENARQRNGGPALAEVPFARRKEGRPWWVWAIAALLGVNLVVLLVVLLRSPDPAPVTEAAPPPAAVAQTAVTATPPPAAAPIASPPVQAATAPAAGAEEPAMPARSLADEAASTGSAPQTDPDAPALAANVPDRAPIVRPLNSGAPATTSRSGIEENLPTLNELTGDRAVGMPPMHLDIHVYSTNPAERFVFINMRKYTEGATLTEGPLLEKIRTDGVVLNQRGFRFVLPRQ